MSNVSKQIYRQLNELFSDLKTLEPFTRIDLAEKGLPELNAVAFESTPERVDFVLSRYRKEGCRLIASPSFVITANHLAGIANVVSYKDDDYCHDAVKEPVEIGTMAQSVANGLLYGLLQNMQSKGAKKVGAFNER